MLSAQIHQEVSFAHVKKVALEIHSVDVWISTNALHWINHVERTRFVKTPNRDSSASALRDTKQSLMQKLHVKDLRSTYFVKVISIAQIMPNVLKVNASVKMVLKLLDHRASISMSVEKHQESVDLVQSVRIFLDHINANVKQV